MMIRIWNLAAGSKIINFFTDFNRKAIGFFYNSMTYRISRKWGSFFNRVIIKAASKSKIINAARNALTFVDIKDAGLFIVLVVAFNTAALIFVGKEINIFSIIARIAFLGLGLILILKKR